MSNEIRKHKIYSSDEIEADPVGIAAKMWKIRKGLSSNKEWVERKDDDKLADFNVFGFAAFIQKFSIVAKQMILGGEYSGKAFQQYLDKVKKMGYKTQEEWAERQADYVKYLWRAYNNHGDLAEGQRIWRHTKESIIKDLNSFKDDYQKAKQMVEEHQQEINRLLKNDVINLSRNEEIRKKLYELYINNKTV